MDFLNLEILDNSLGNWLIALGISLGVYAALALTRRLLKFRLIRLVERTSSKMDDIIIPVLEQTRWFGLLGLALYLGAPALALPPDFKDWFYLSLRLVLILQAGFWGNGAISYYIGRSVQSRIEDDRGAEATTLDGLGLIGKIALWIVLGLLVLDNLEVEISSLVTSLGIGGIAVALAVQNILGDLFASLSISLDKPFVIGDYVQVGDFEGNVEDIGLKSTRIRSSSGEELIFSNTDLLKSRIRNFKRLERRRVSFSFGVVYGTPAALLQQIPQIMEEIIATLDHADFKRAHFRSLGDFALEFTVIYHVLLPEYSVYLDLQQTINLTICQRFEELGIKFAYPTQTVLLEQEK